MRQRRHGDPNVEIPIGRQPKPKPTDPELDAVKRENAALREQVQALTRERDEARAKGGAAILLDRLAAIVKEREANGLAMSKARKLRAAIHPDSARDEVERKRRDQASVTSNKSTATRVTRANRTQLSRSSRVTPSKLRM
jgi:hypothetical protein